MKKCEQFKDLILTDYIDGQCDKQMSMAIENHLLDCGDCRIFFKEVKNNVSLPLKQALHQPVPLELWDTIKQRIEAEQQVTSPVTGVWDNVMNWFAFPRLVPVFASVVVMFIVGSMAFNTVQVNQAKDKEQGEYLLALLTPTSNTNDTNDPGTPIEHYFL